MEVKGKDMKNIKRLKLRKPALKRIKINKHFKIIL